MKSALITGITGQDGSYLAEFLLEKGYEVYGLVRRSSTQNNWRISHIVENDDLHLLEGDMTDTPSLVRALNEASPDEVYNLAAQSFVGTSFKQPEYTSDVTGLGVMRLLEAMRRETPDARFYQASTSEMFGDVHESPQTEQTVFHPRSPYGVAKVFGHWATVMYREAYDMYTVSGILFNHESPRRGEEFVTRKITLGAARIAEGNQDELRLGNLDARRDWGNATEYVEGMHAMLQQDPSSVSDYVMGTGEMHTVRECARIAFEEVGLDYQEYVVIDEKFYRPAEVDVLRSDPSKIEEELGWSAETPFESLIREMVQRDLQRVQDGDIYWTEPQSDLRSQSAHPGDGL